MKKYVVIALTALLLSGCGGEEVFEIVEDAWAEPVLAQVRRISFALPPEAASPVLEDESGTVYACDGYEIYQQVLPAGDLFATVRAVSGYGAEDLTVIKIQQADAKRYDFVWASASDSGDRVGKAAILDDGDYHYVLTVLGDAETAETHQEVWQEIFDSYGFG